GSPVITAASARFSADDVGKLIIICAKPGGKGRFNSCRNSYTGRIAAVQTSNRASLASAYPGANQPGAFAFFASDDTAALQAAIDATGDVSSSRTGVIRLPGRPVMIIDP